MRGDSKQPPKYPTERNYRRSESPNSIYNTLYKESSALADAHNRIRKLIHHNTDYYAGNRQNIDISSEEFYKPINKTLATLTKELDDFAHMLADHYAKYKTYDDMYGYERGYEVFSEYLQDTFYFVLHNMDRKYDPSCVPSADDVFLLMTADALIDFKIRYQEQKNEVNVNAFFYISQKKYVNGKAVDDRIRILVDNKTKMTSLDIVMYVTRPEICNKLLHKLKETIQMVKQHDIERGTFLTHEYIGKKLLLESPSVLQRQATSLSNNPTIYDYQQKMAFAVIEFALECLSKDEVKLLLRNFYVNHMSHIQWLGEIQPKSKSPNSSPTSSTSFFQHTPDPAIFIRFLKNRLDEFYHTVLADYTTESKELFTRQSPIADSVESSPLKRPKQ